MDDFKSRWYVFHLGRNLVTGETAIIASASVTRLSSNPMGQKASTLLLTEIEDRASYALLEADYMVSRDMLSHKLKLLNKKWNTSLEGKR